MEARNVVWGGAAAERIILMSEATLKAETAGQCDGSHQYFLTCNTRS